MTTGEWSCLISFTWLRWPVRNGEGAKNAKWKYIFPAGPYEKNTLLYNRKLYFTTENFTTQTGIPCGTLEIVIQEVFRSIRRSCWAICSNPLTNVKWHSDPWPRVTSLPIRLSTNFMTFIPSLTFNELWVVSMEHLQRVWLASRERLPFRTPGSVPILGLANAPIVETKFLELAMSLLDFSPRIPLGTFSMLLTLLLKTLL